MMPAGALVGNFAYDESRQSLVDVSEALLDDRYQKTEYLILDFQGCKHLADVLALSASFAALPALQLLTLAGLPKVQTVI